MSAQKVMNDSEAQEFGLILTDAERAHLQELERSCIFIETKKEMSTFDLIELLRVFGCVKIVKIRPTGFWCNFVDIEPEESVKTFMHQIEAQNPKVVSCVKGHKQVSTYYLANL